VIILDTDHITVLQRAETEAANALRSRLRVSGEDVWLSIPSFEEQMRGWLSLIGRYSNVRQQVEYYRRLQAMIPFYGDWRIIAFEKGAADEFLQLRKRKVRISSTDLKIAAIAIVNSALLLTRNERDFAKVPELRFEDWLSN